MPHHQVWSATCERKCKSIVGLSKVQILNIQHTKHIYNHIVSFTQIQHKSLVLNDSFCVVAANYGIALVSVGAGQHFSLLYNKENFSTLLLRRKDLKFAVLQAYVEYKIVWIWRPSQVDCDSGFAFECSLLISILR